MTRERILKLSAVFTLVALAVGSVFAYSAYNRNPVSIRPAHTCAGMGYRAVHAGLIKSGQPCISWKAGRIVNSNGRVLIPQDLRDSKLCKVASGDPVGIASVRSSMDMSFCGMDIISGSFLRVRRMLEGCKGEDIPESDLIFGRFLILNP